MTPTQFKAIRESLGLSQTELGAKIGLSMRQVRRIENEGAKPKTLVVREMNRLNEGL